MLNTFQRIGKSDTQDSGEQDRHTVLTSQGFTFCWAWGGVGGWGVRLSSDTDTCYEGKGERSDFSEASLKV